jgi:hypothetical protein
MWREFCCNATSTSLHPDPARWGNGRRLFR